ncbi:hypothetical protein [Pseudoxanthomonas suwonensis]|uniref:hypothetical protein n=1 Tax=Pseudoxanthomonas suwonensis TaxID=314722 RepID=UPI00048CDB70|nr:hypothetical protein [Pseudoxanthomonas suwonensis]
MIETEEDRLRRAMSGATFDEAIRAGTIGGHASGASEAVKMAAEQNEVMFRRMREEAAVRAAATAGVLPSASFDFGALGRTVGILAKIVFWAAMVLLMPFLAVAATGWYLAPSHRGIDAHTLSTQAISAAHYATTDPQVRAFSQQRTTSLLSRYFPARPQLVVYSGEPLWSRLSSVQQHAAEAIWMRYVRDPASFRSLSKEQREWVFPLLRGYLDHRVESGDVQAWVDMGRFNRDWFNDASAAHGPWLMGAMAHPENAELDALSASGGALNTFSSRFERGFFYWRGFFPDAEKEVGRDE